MLLLIKTYGNKSFRILGDILMMDKIMKNRFHIMAVILIAVFCFAITPIGFQNDTFYTIRVGEHIMEHGIDGYDPFSWHDLEYTYKHWGYNVATYLVYRMRRTCGSLHYDCHSIYGNRNIGLLYPDSNYLKTK